MSVYQRLYTRGRSLKKNSFTKEALKKPRGQKPHDRPDVGTRVFKMKLTELLDDLTKREIFGKSRAVVYVIEFQKRGLPHAHILLWLEEEWKCTTPTQIDDIISAEIPCPTDDPEGYKVVTEFMLHGPCGKGAACTVEGKCSKRFPKPFYAETIIDDDGYPVYRRRDSKVFAVKGKFTYDNKYVVPYNRFLLLRYQAHINVEWCNRSKAIKYLFKYLNKGLDRATIVIQENVQKVDNETAGKVVEVDEIKNDVSRPLQLWEQSWQILSEDILHKKRKLFKYPDLQLTDEQLKNYCLLEIEALLNRNGRSLTDFLDLPRPDPTLLTHIDNQLIREALDYDIKKRIASLLLPGGRTAHSRFVIPLELMENSTCAPMTQKYAFEALDKTLMDILGFKCPEKRNKIFGGVTVLLGGDFRQILLVIPKGKRNEIVQACINKSELWKSCKVYTLSRSMRVNEYSSTGEIDTRKQQFNKWVLDVGDGNLPAKKKDEDEETWIEIPEEFIISSVKSPIEEIVKETFPDFATKQSEEAYLKERAILTPQNDDADAINAYMFEKLPGPTVTYNSADEVCKASTDTLDQQHLYPVEFLNSLNFSGMPPHALHLKKGLPIMLLRNVNPSQGLCNRTRLIITDLGQFVIRAQILTGSNVGATVLIPRITLTSTQTQWPFIMKRRQFPVKPCYAMTINKSQGQSLNYVGRVSMPNAQHTPQIHLPAQKFTTLSITVNIFGGVGVADGICGERQTGGDELVAYPPRASYELDDGDSMEAKKITAEKSEKELEMFKALGHKSVVVESKKHRVAVFIKAPPRAYSKPFMRFSTPYGVDGQGAWDAELDMVDSHNYMTEEMVDKLGEPYVIFVGDFLVTSKSKVDFGVGEMRIDLTMLEEERDIDALLLGLVKNIEGVGNSNEELVKIGKASRNKGHNVNKLTPPPPIKIEENPPFSSIAPQPIYHPLSQKQKEKIKEVLDKKYKEVEEPKPILDVLENYMTYRIKLDEVMMGRARLSNNEFSEEDNMRIIEHGLPKKMCDPGNFLLPNLGLSDPRPYHSNLTMADITQAKSMGKVKNVRIQVGYQVYLVDFLVLDISVDKKLPLLLGYPFLRTCGAVIDMGRGTMSIDDGVIRHTYFPKPRAKAYLENFEVDKEDDWLSCFEVGRDKDGNPKYGPVAPSFLDIEDEMVRALAMEAYFNPFKNIIVFKKLVDFLGSLQVQLKNTVWGNEGYGMYKKIEGDRAWHAKFDVITPIRHKFTRGFKTKETKRKLSEKFTSEDILKFDHFLD
ncbi:ATP-dependent DNA helicase PIF1-like protein [Tanacetum coccineum]